MAFDWLQVYDNAMSARVRLLWTSTAYTAVWPCLHAARSNHQTMTGRVGAGGDDGLIVGQPSCATEQGKPSELECENKPESREVRMAFSPSGSDSGTEFARYHKLCTHAILSFLSQGIEGDRERQIARDHPRAGKAHPVSRTTHGQNRPQTVFAAFQR